MRNETSAREIIVFLVSSLRIGKAGFYCSTGYKGNTSRLPDEGAMTKLRRLINFIYIYLIVWSSFLAEYGSAGKVASPARGQLNRPINIFPCPSSRLIRGQKT